MGRITRDLELKGEPEKEFVKFTLAVNRRTKGEADFINCVVFGKTARFMSQHMSKGRQIVLEGRIQTGSYEKDGNKVYTTDVIVESFNFADSNKSNSGGNLCDKEDLAYVGIDAHDELPF